MLYLRQSTASQAVVIGPFVDSTDGNTAETGLTIDAADIRLSKNGANIVGKNSGGGTHDELGYYTITLDATDTDTVGRLQVMVHEAGALPVYHDFQVLEEAVFDALVASSALGYVANAPVNVAQISGDSTAADNLETAFDDTAGAVPWQGIVDQGTAQSATGTTLVLRAAAAFADDELIGATIVITGGTAGVGQSRLITDYVSATDTATVDTWTTTPTGTITYKIIGTAASSSGSAPSAATVAAAVWDASQASHTTSGSFGEIATEIASVLVDTNELQTDLTNGGRLDLLVDAIKAKTDPLTYTVANVLDANVQRINDVVITGDGQAGTEFGV